MSIAKIGWYVKIGEASELPVAFIGCWILVHGDLSVFKLGGEFPEQNRYVDNPHQNRLNSTIRVRNE